jgi:sporulation related protein
MADDQGQRPYRASEPPPARGAGKTSGSDPLAELARLIGQTDPFGEFARDAARRAAPPQQQATRADWNQPLGGGSYTAQYGGEVRAPEPVRYGGNGVYVPPSAPVSPPVPQDYSAHSHGRQAHEPAPADFDQYDEAAQGAQRFPLDRAEYQQDFYDQTPVDEEYYEDVQPSRRRTAVMAIAGVVALAVIGTAGAFGYRAFFSSSAPAKPPPVIKADTAPNKIVPTTNGKDAQSNRLITDRVNERGQSEKLVSREEQPLDRPTAVVLSQQAQQPPLGSGVIGGEPKKVRTIAIHPDQPVVADAAPTSMSAAAAAAARPQPAPQPRVAVAPAARAAPDNAPAETEASTPQAPPPRAAAPARQAAAASGSAPLSLNPNAAPSRAAAPAPAPAPARTASVAPQAPATAVSGGAGSYVQVSSQRSEGEAQSAFRSLQAKFPDQLGGRQPYIHKVDLGAKGTYYRAMVGPFGNASEASQLCSSLKAAGGQCLVQRN